MRKQDNFFRTQIRVPTDIYGAIKDSAMENGRSINAEIIELFLIGLGEKEPPITESILRMVIHDEFSKNTQHLDTKEIIKLLLTGLTEKSSPVTEPILRNMIREELSKEQVSTKN